MKAYIGYSKIIGYSRITIIIIMQEAKILTKNIQSSSPASSIAEDVSVLWNSLPVRIAIASAVFDIR